MTETQWTREIVDDLKNCNTVVFAIVGGMMQQPGWPDRYIAHTLWQGHLEFKGVKTRVGDKQKIIIRELNLRQQGIAYVIRQPNRIERWDGSLVEYFNGSGRGLLHKLAEVS